MKRHQPNSDRLPKLIRFLALHAAFGAVLGIVIAAALLWLDIAGLGGLFAAERATIAPALLYFGSFAFTFASGAMGTAVMLLPKSEDEFPRA